MTTERDGLVERLRAKAERLDDGARDLCLDAGSWREAADRLAGRASGFLMNNALENERVAGEQEATGKLLLEAADALSAAQRLVEEMRALESYVLGSPERRAWTNACRTCAAKLVAALLSERSPRP